MLGNSTYTCFAWFLGVRQRVRHESQFVGDNRSHGQPECYPAHQSNGSRYLPRVTIWGWSLYYRQGK